jgi:VanZ family protein
VSRLDVLVNITISLPLGFFLMGGLASRRRRSLAGLAEAVLVVGCVSALLGMSVELLQLVLPTRQSSWNDVLAQGIGGGGGALGSILAGPKVIPWLRGLANALQPPGGVPVTRPDPATYISLPQIELLSPS